MTLVAILSNSMSAILIADSRLTWRDRSDPSRRWYGDECQKVVRLGNEGLVGFSGDVGTAVTVLRHITDSYSRRGTSWLKSKEEIHGLLVEAGIRRSSPRASFLATFIDRGHLVLGYPSGPVPGAAMIEFNTDGSHSRSYLGLKMIGGGSDEVYSEIEKDPGVIPIMNMGLPPNDKLSMARSGLFLAEVIAGTALSAGINGVGGLFQVHLMMTDGVIAVPYERWIDIDDNFGTYVSMEIQNGQWVQVHAPTGLRIPIGLLYEGDFQPLSEYQNYTFDIRESLNKNSPGVIPRTNSQRVYRIPDGKIHTP